MFYSAFWLSDDNCCVFVLGGVGRCIFKTQGSHVLGRSMTASPSILSSSHTHMHRYSLHSSCAQTCGPVP